MTGIEWAQAIADARIARQLEQVDGLDMKAGLMFAYSGAVLVGAPAIGTRGDLSVSFFLCTVILALISVLLNILVLYPRRFNDPPNARAFADDVGEERVHLDWARKRLMKDQVRATERNESVIRWKIAGMKVAVIFATAATGTLWLQVMGKEGYIGG